VPLVPKICKPLGIDAHLTARLSQTVKGKGRPVGLCVAVKVMHEQHKGAERILHADGLHSAYRLGHPKKSRHTHTQLRVNTIR